MAQIEFHNFFLIFKNVAPFHHDYGGMTDTGNTGCFIHSFRNSAPEPMEIYSHCFYSERGRQTKILQKYRSDYYILQNGKAIWSIQLITSFSQGFSA